MGKIPKSFHKHDDVAGPAQVSLQEDAVLVQEEGGHLGTQGPEAMALGGSCLLFPSKVAVETIFLGYIFAPVSSLVNKWSMPRREGHKEQQVEVCD